MSKITDEQYKEVIETNPEDRVGDCGVDLDNKINGILLAFKMKCEQRDGWLDIITVSDAQREIKELIQSETKTLKEI